VYLAAAGTARITEGGGPEQLQRLAHVSLGPDSNFPQGDDPPEGWIMRIAPERWHGHGPWSSYRPPSDTDEGATSSS
jgi:hypothetical protein